MNHAFDIFFIKWWFKHSESTQTIQVLIYMYSIQHFSYQYETDKNMIQYIQ